MEELLVGEDGDAVGSGGFVGFCGGDGVEVGGDDACAGAGLFDLGDEGEGEWVAVFVAPLVEGGGESAKVVALKRGGAEVVGFGEDFGDFGLFDVDDFLQARGQHGRWC